MKPLHVGILVVVAAVGGGLFTKWQTSRNVAQVSAMKPATAPAASVEKPAATEPVAATQPAAARPVEAAAKAQVSQPERYQALNEMPRKHGKMRPVQPRMVARSVAPHQEPEVNPAPEPAANAEPPAQVEISRPAPTQSEAAPAEPAPAVNVPKDSPAPPPPPVQVTLRSGTLLSTRTVEGLSSERNQVGDTFTATLEQPLSVDGWVIAERGAHLEGKIVQSQRAGRVKGQSDLAIELTQLVTSDGQRVPIETETFIKHGQPSTGEDAAKIGVGAVIGATIGAIAGGGKGAGIGAAAGGAAGAGDVMLTRGKPAALPAETHINFRLRNSVTITERTGRMD
ncbi:MAG TPA: hypothetical protein VNH83_10900 [Bryobacteraceae bacterium]|nr:hypothetical protein [Bryobacteraceae bacterium]